MFTELSVQMYFPCVCCLVLGRVRTLIPPAGVDRVPKRHGEAHGLPPGGLGPHPRRLQPAQHRGAGRGRGLQPGRRAGPGRLPLGAEAVRRGAGGDLHGHRERRRGRRGSGPARLQRAQARARPMGPAPQGNTLLNLFHSLPG